MACYHPSQMFILADPSTGALTYKLAGRAVDTARHAREINVNNPNVVDVINIPCRRCAGCRLDYSRDWANRMLLEYQRTRKAVFVTLTYDDQHIPTSDLGYATLCKRDCQLWLKRVRKHFAGTEIRFFLGGEYGPSTHRPHYHAILFGVDLLDFGTLTVRNVNELGQCAYESGVLNTLWPNGFSTVAAVSFQTFAYCSRYILKKQRTSDYYLDDTQKFVPEFSLMSRRPGLGAYAVDDSALDGINCTVSDGTDTKTFPLPSALLRRLKDVDPQKYAELKYARKDLADDRLAFELEHSSLSFTDYLKQREDSLLARTVRIRDRKEL